MNIKADRKCWTSELDDLDTGPVPIGPYIDPDFFEREREKIFRAVWLNVAREEEIPNPGDYVVKEIEILRTSIIIVRGKDKKIRAFHNMCAHRGNKVLIEKCGKVRGLTCFFHGWTFDLEGNLRGIPDEAGFFDLNKDELGLTEVASGDWEGFVFINVSKNPSQTLLEFLGDYAPAMAGFPLSEASACYSWTAEMNVNWKVAKDAFAEAYHVKALHRRSVAEALNYPTNPHGHALSFHVYGPHQCMSLGGNTDFEPSPVALAAAKHGAGMKRYEISRGLDDFPPGINPTGASNWIFELTSIFPNMNLHYFRNNFTTYNFWPLSVDRTLWEVKQYYIPAKNASEAFAQEVHKNLFRDTVLEDLSTLERTQSVLNSGAKDTFVLNDEEVLVRRFNKLVDEYLAVEPAS
ncbi:MAG: aromatic ring-hydroxylating dioxygenase subunit alpha [Kordiimonadaceae bacterium]|nr:aromatic ring-hydroxylating dioxygenase subunit alpha [Kordiimonadaceae bacterium]